MHLKNAWPVMVSFLALDASLAACSDRSEQIIPAKPAISIIGEYGERQEYTLVKKVSLKEAGSLEESLLATPNVVPDLGKEIELELSLSRLPEVLYHLKIDPNDGLRPLSLGSCYLINGEGFFLTAHHVFEKYLQESKTEEMSSFMLLYDPVSKSAAAALPLIYSVEKDILLGKANLPRYPRQSAPLSDNDRHLFNNVYSVTYANIDYLSKELLHTVLSSGTITENLEFVQGEEVDADIKLLGVNISIGRLVGRGAEQEKLGRRGFLADLVRGNSGSPVFDLINNQVGVVNEKMTFKDLSPNAASPNITLYTGSTAIREMIQIYIDQIKK